jgi:hypothetical protein
MTDEPKPTYEELEAINTQLERQLKYVRDERDTALKTGSEWRDLANERKTLVENLRGENKAVTIEAAELRGYIRRVNELDPKHVRQQKRERTGPDLDYLMRGRR